MIESKKNAWTSKEPLLVQALICYCIILFSYFDKMIEPTDLSFA
jgi:hypothetical protein